MRIMPCAASDLDDWTALRGALWPDEEELRARAQAMLAEPDKLALLCRSDAGEALAFAEASIRRDYVNGCDSTPVAFLEGIYVVPGHRHAGAARALRARRDLGARVRLHRIRFRRAAGECCKSTPSTPRSASRRLERVVYFKRPL